MRPAAFNKDCIGAAGDNDPRFQTSGKHNQSIDESFLLDTSTRHSVELPSPFNGPHSQFHSVELPSPFNGPHSQFYQCVELRSPGKRPKRSRSICRRACRCACNRGHACLRTDPSYPCHAPSSMAPPGNLTRFSLQFELNPTITAFEVGVQHHACYMPYTTQHSLPCFVRTLPFFSCPYSFAVCCKHTHHDKH